MKKLFCFGYGYSAQFLSSRMNTMGWQTIGTTRQKIGQNDDNSSVNYYQFSDTKPLNDEAIEHLENAEAILISIPPNRNGCPVFNTYSDLIAKNKNLKWVGYLSTTGVYGHKKGEWVDETFPTVPATPRGKNRLLAEEQWLNLFKKAKCPLHIFRLAGIYGPGRTPMLRIQRGMGQIISKPGHYFNRIHVDDIALTLQRSIQYPKPGEIYNLCDDEPSTQMDVMYFSYRLLGQMAPMPISFKTANLSDMARSFYMTNKRVKNNKIKKDLGIILQYPTYRKGLTALHHGKGFL